MSLALLSFPSGKLSPAETMSLFDCPDYRSFILEALVRRGSTRRELGEAIGRSEGWLSYVLGSRKRDMRPHLIRPTAAFLKLDAEEATFFAALVDLEHGSDLAQMKASAIIDAKRGRTASEQQGNEYVTAFSRWYVPAILELASCEDFQDDPEWIARTLNPQIEADQAADAIRALLELGLLVRAAGELRPASPTSETPSDLPPGDHSKAAIGLHRSGFELAAGAMAAHRQNERHITTTMMALSEEQAPVVIARLRELEREVMLLASPGSERPNRVFMLGIAMFPVTDYSDSGDG